MPLDSDPPVSLTRAQIARLEAEARAVLASVELVSVTWERNASRERRAKGEAMTSFDPRPSGAVIGTVPLASWRPRATRTPSGWTVEGGWLDEAVPELPTGGVPNAGGVAPMLADPANEEHMAAVQDRHGFGPLFVPVVARDPLDVGGLIWMLRAPPARWSYQPKSVEKVGGAWQTARDDAREWPGLELVTRGWCPGLGAGWLATIQEGTAAGWLAMQRAHDGVMRTTDAAWTAERAAIVRAKGEG
ncbi:MAG: hypothetical protein RIS45_1269 [Planctomycetota bacterium]|jgi:hypothetical protein